MNQIKLVKFIDKMIGKTLVFLLSEKNLAQEGVSKKILDILFIRPGGIGDAVLLVPAIEAVRRKFPDARIDILCEKRNVDIFGLTKAVNKVYVYDRGLELLQCLRNNYDVVIDTEQWHRLSAVVAYLTKAPKKIGFSTNERRNVFTHQIPYSHDDYEVYSFFHLVEPLIGNGIGFNVNEPFLNITDDIPSPLLAWFKERKDKVVALFPGASVKERRWGGTRYGKVGKALGEKGYAIVILGSIKEREEAEEIKASVGDHLDLTGEIRLRDIPSVLRRCRALITADSGLLHIAYAVGTPTVSLFGSGIEKKWAPCGDRHIVLNKHLDCSPCTRFGYTPKCRRNVECLALIHVDEVIEAARRTLDAS